MRREIFIHFAFWFFFFVLITLLRQHFVLSYWPFWLGGILGIFLPDIDHILYVYFSKPQELTSQRINYLVNKKELKRSVELLYETRGERTGLIFHTVLFQIIFLVVTFWIMSSSGSLFGRGLALSFALHLNVDQLVDLMELKSFDTWLRNSPIKLDFEKAKVYLAITSVLILILGLF